MGYTTDFDGSLTLSKPLTKKQLEYINKLAETRRMKRDVAKLMELYKGKHGYPGRTPAKNTPEEIYGIDGEFFVGAAGFGGQDSDASVTNYNIAPGQAGFMEKSKGQPGLWLQWTITENEEDGSQQLEWDGGEKFYNYVEWLEYLILKFFIPWKVQLNGEILWYGEDRSDTGKIVVTNNEVKVYEAEETKFKEKR